MVNNNRIPESELVLNKDGSVYHIHLKKEHIADTVLLVGDQKRVLQISRHFDTIDFKMQNREFVTHTGTYRGTRITALSTGIGSDNIDIVINELDAAVNIDATTRIPHKERKQLNLIRIGTSGGLREDVPVGTFLISEFGLGFDGLIYYYQYDFNNNENTIQKKINEHLQWNPNLAKPYITEGSKSLIQILEKNMKRGITATATGFYGPQGRKVILTPSDMTINERLASFEFEGHHVTNFEMETSALYGLGNLLGHRCCTCCAIIANRVTQKYHDNYVVLVDDLIEDVLGKLAGGGI